MNRATHERVPRAVTCRLSLILLLLALVTPSASGQPETTRPVLRLAMSGAFQPFSTTDAKGNLVGLDADIAREIARRLGSEPVLVQTDWAGIQAGLQAGKYDLICGSMAITDARLRTMLFSLPYYVSGAQIFVHQGIEDVHGIRLGVTEDSTYASYIAEHSEQFPGVEITRYGSESEIIAAMNTDKVDGLVSDRIVGGFYIAKGSAGDIVALDGLLYREAVGIAARKDSGALVRDVNQALLAMIQDGTYDAIYRKWVGAAPDLGLLLSTWGDYAGNIPKSAAPATSTAAHAARPAFVETLGAMLPLLGRGAALTLVLSLLTAVIALGTGALIGVGTAARPRLIRSLSTGYIGIVRGTPLLVQLFISYFALATLVNRLAGGEIVGAFGAALFALVINTTAYNAETIRGGIAAVDSGQWDAAASIGMKRSLILRRVILPQAFRDSLPSLGNNLVVLIKDTSLVGAITLIELTYAARNVVFQTGQAFLPFIVAALFYLVIITLVTLLTRRWEAHLGRSRKDVRVSL